MLKKFFVAMFLTVFALVSNNICNAKMPRSEMYLGGFTVGSSYFDMVKVYGEPIKTGGAENNISAKYGSGVVIGYNNYNNKIQSITVTENNGWKTPRGFSVSSNISDVLDLYGNADYTESGSFKVAYCYFGEMKYSKHYQRYIPDFGFIFLVNKNSGKILQMGVYGGGTMTSFDETYQSYMKYMVK